MGLQPETTAAEGVITCLEVVRKHDSRNDALRNSERAINPFAPVRFAPSDYKNTWFIHEHAPNCDRTKIPDTGDVLDCEVSLRSHSHRPSLKKESKSRVGQYAARVQC